MAGRRLPYAAPAGRAGDTVGVPGEPRPLPDDIIRYAFDDPALKTPDDLRIDPNGRIPAIEDGGFALSESLL